MSPRVQDSFFDKVSAYNLPGQESKAQPWKEFHEPQAELANNGTLEIDIPTTEETGGFLGRSTQTGSLGGH